MAGENLFKLISISVLGLVFVSIASADKNIQPPTKDKPLPGIFNHISLAAQANAYNQNITPNPPEMTAESKTDQESLPKSKE